MALFRDDQGKTEQPTPTRLDEVRKRGDSPLSRELVQGGVLVVAALAFRFGGSWLLESIATLLRHGLQVDVQGKRIESIGDACRTLLHAISTVIMPFALLALTLVLATLVLGYGQIGVRWAGEAVGWKPEKLNPFTNFKRVLNVQSLVRTGFALIKLAVLLTVLWFVVGGELPALLQLHEQELDVAANEIASLGLSIMLWVGIVVFVISVGDLAYQRYDFTQRNMMTKQEVEDERKRSEGDPTMKMRQRRARNDLLRQRMMTAVPKADVIIVNPTHFSVALRYDRKRDAAPTVVAKGVDDIALHIREIAKEHGVPLMEDPPLARALYRSVKVGQVIPEKFYQAVATVLSHVYRLKGRTA